MRVTPPSGRAERALREFTRPEYARCGLTKTKGRDGAYHRQPEEYVQRRLKTNAVRERAGEQGRKNAARDLTPTHARAEGGAGEIQRHKGPTDDEVRDQHDAEYETASYVAVGESLLGASPGGRPGETHYRLQDRERPTLDIDARAGNTYYVWQEVKMGVFAARSALHLVDEHTGEDGVKQCKLIQ